MRVRAHRLDPAEPIPFGRPATRSRSAFAMDARAASAAHLDLGSRIGLAADIQAHAGNRAMAGVAAFARADHKTQPPKGINEIQEAGKGSGNRGYTQSRYTANPPLFRIGKTEQVNGKWQVTPVPARLPDLDYDVWWPSPGRHLLGPYGKGNRYVEVTPEWSELIRQGEEEHVADTDKAWEMTWGRVASVINELANGKPFTGSSVEEATKSAWSAFLAKLPKGFRPAGDTPTAEAQEAVWGADDPKTVHRKLMTETKTGRDWKGWHTPDESQKATVGQDMILELSKGNSRIGEVSSTELIETAWKKLTEAR